jgi:oligoribonuclease NrnB/cAMP/cGMP phosphodiesterase (DHH superfamily)
VNLYWPERRLFRSERRKQRRRLARWDAAERKAKTTLLLSHAHCLDVVGAAIVTLRALGPDNVGVAYVQPGDMAHVLSHFSKAPGKGRRFMVADLSLQPEQYNAIVASCAALKANGWTLEWRDHHHKQWEGLDLSSLRSHLAALEVNSDATESGASLQQQALAPADGFLRRLAETVRDRDLWWNKTPDSETLEFALSELGTKEFVQHFLDADPGSAIVDASIQAAAQREKDRQGGAKGKLLSEARYFGEGPTKVGVVYGWLPKNTGLHDLLEDHGCQVAINVRPNGKVSLRSRKAAAVCHLIAKEFRGGGHPNASGADLGLKGPSYWWYVLRHGNVPATERMATLAVRVLSETPPSTARPEDR